MVSIGYIHAGEAVNIIPATANLGIDVRTFSQDTRIRVLGALRRIIDAESTAAGAPPPDLVETRAYPFLVNDEIATRKVEHVFGAHFGDAYDAYAQGLGGSEDCGILATVVGRPIVYFMYGATDPVLWEKLENEGGQEGVPSTHSASFAPDLGALRFGVDGYAGAALAFLTRW